MMTILTIYFILSAIITIMAQPWQHTKNKIRITIAFFLIGMIGTISAIITVLVDSTLSKIEKDD